MSVRPDPHPAPVREPNPSPSLAATQGALKPECREARLAADVEVASRFAFALRHAEATLESVGVLGHGIAAPRWRRQVPDGPRILARDELAAHLAAEAEPPR